jgi:hypothetical protein
MPDSIRDRHNACPDYYETVKKSGFISYRAGGRTFFNSDLSLMHFHALIKGRFEGLDAFEVFSNPNTAETSL